MAPVADSWTREFTEASKLADDISIIISGKESLSPAEPDTQRHFSASRRKVTILRTKLDTLESLLSKLPNKQQITSKELRGRQDMLTGLRSKANQMASTLNMSDFARRELIGEDVKPVDLMSRTTGLDNQSLVSFQRQILKEQDQDLEKLEETILSTKHIALAVNEELDLHTRLIDALDQHVDSTDSQLQRVQKRLAILNKRTKGGCSLLALLLAVFGIVILVFVAWELIKYF